MPAPDRLAGTPTFTVAGPGSGPPGPTSGVGEVVSLPTLATVMPMAPRGETANTLSITLPQKLSQRILQLEYIEMAELIPETWGLEPEGVAPCCHQSRRQFCRGPVVDILL